MLQKIKKSVAERGFRFINRDKNVRFMQEYFLTPDDIREVIFDLSVADCISGLEEDRDGYSGYVLTIHTQPHLRFTLSFDTVLRMISLLFHFTKMKIIYHESLPFYF